MPAQHLVDPVQAAAKPPRHTPGAVILISFVLLISVSLAAGEAAADPSPAQAHPQPSVELSDTHALLFLHKPDRVAPTLRNDGSERPESWELQVRTSDWLSAGPRETISYTAWMTAVLPTKVLRARAIQTTTHESIGDFILPTVLPQAQMEAIILSVAAQESGDHGFNNEMVTAGWSRGIMQITADAYVGASAAAGAHVGVDAGALHEHLVDWEHGGKRVIRWICAAGDGFFGEPTTIHVPEASFTAAPASPHTGQWVSFDASASSHPEDIVSYHWDFGDGRQTDAGPRVAYRYTSPGSYTVRLTVREAHGAVDTSSAVLTVIFEVTDAVYLSLVLR